jgi:hypothetical protein
VEHPDSEVRNSPLPQHPGRRGHVQNRSQPANRWIEAKVDLPRHTVMIAADMWRVALMVLPPLADSTVTVVHSVTFGSRRQGCLRPRRRFAYPRRGL